MQGLGWGCQQRRQPVQLLGRMRGSTSGVARRAGWTGRPADKSGSTALAAPRPQQTCSKRALGSLMGLRLKSPSRQVNRKAAVASRSSPSEIQPRGE